MRGAKEQYVQLAARATALLEHITNRIKPEDDPISEEVIASWKDLLRYAHASQTFEFT